MKHRLSLIVIYFILCISEGFAKDDAQVNFASFTLSSGTIMPGAPMVLDKFFTLYNGGLGNVHQINKLDNVVIFSIKKNTSSYFANQKFESTITVNIDMWDINGATMTPLNNVDLKVSYDPYYPEKSNKLKDEIYFKGAAKYEVTIVNYTTTNASPILDNIFELEGRSYIDFNTNVNCGLPYNAKFSPTINNAGKLFMPLALLSSAPNFIYDEIDIEWAYIDSLSSDGIEMKALFGMTNFPASNILNTNLIEKIAKKTTFSRTTFRNQTGVFELPNTYLQGYILYRTRLVALRNNGERITCDWSYKASAGQLTVISLYTPDPSLPPPPIIYKPFPSQNLNWHTDLSFAEEGKQKQVATFYDGMQRDRQVITQSNTDGTVIVGESYYDVEGRKAGIALPTPNMQSSLFQHVNGFNRNMSNEPYSGKDFSLGCGVLPAPMNPTSGASLYYSPNNPKASLSYHKYIPDAENYPFYTIDFSADNTSQILKQGGVGLKMQINNNTSTQFFTRNFYGKPNSQEELDRLFGSEAGYKDHYLKNMTIDPNGQATVTYINMEGKTVATGLAGNPSASSTGLVNNTNQPTPVTMSYNVITEANLEKNELTNSIIGSSSVLISQDQTVTFNVNLKDALYTDVTCTNSSFCSDCYYDIKVTISDDCGNPVHTEILKNYTSKAPPLSILCNLSHLNTINKTFTLPLIIGSYTVTSEISIPKDVLDYYETQYGEKSGCVKSLTAIQEQLDKYKADYSCIKTCKECTDVFGEESSLGAPNATRVKFIEDIASTFTDKDGKIFIDGNEVSLANFIQTTGKLAAEAIYQECKNLRCSAKSDCDKKKELLASDLKFNGQYGFLRFKETTTDGIVYRFLPTDKTSIFHPDNKFSAILIDVLKNDPVILALNKHEEDLTSQDLIDNWQDDWIDQYDLLQFHPEYCEYKFCLEHSDFYEFETKLKNIQTFEEAVQAGYITYPIVAGSLLVAETNVMGLVNNDVFFNRIKLPTTSNACFHPIGLVMTDVLSFNFYNKNNSDFKMPLSKWATYMAALKPATIPSELLTTTLSLFGASSNPNFSPFGRPEFCEGQRDMQWAMLRNLYLDIRRKNMQIYRVNYLKSICSKVNAPNIGKIPKIFHMCDNSYIGCAAESVEDKNDRSMVNLSDFNSEDKCFDKTGTFCSIRRDAGSWPWSDDIVTPIYDKHHPGTDINYKEYHQKIKRFNENSDFETNFVDGVEKKTNAEKEEYARKKNLEYGISTCARSAKGWYDQILAKCSHAFGSLTDNTPPLTDKDKKEYGLEGKTLTRGQFNVLKRMVEVCARGVDKDYPLGASSYLPDQVHPSLYLINNPPLQGVGFVTSFDDVFKSYSLGYCIGGKDIAPQVAKSITQKPNELEKNPIKFQFSIPSDCECEKVTTYYNKFIKINSSYSPSAFLSYLNSLGVVFTTINEDRDNNGNKLPLNLRLEKDLDALVRVCKKDRYCDYLGRSVTLPPQFRCVPCFYYTDILDLYNQFTDSKLANIPNNYKFWDEFSTYVNKNKTSSFSALEIQNFFETYYTSKCAGSLAPCSEFAKYYGEFTSTYTNRNPYDENKDNLSEFINFLNTQKSINVNPSSLIQMNTSCVAIQTHPRVILGDFNHAYIVDELTYNGANAVTNLNTHFGTNYSASDYLRVVSNGSICSKQGIINSNTGFRDQLIAIAANYVTFNGANNAQNTAIFENWINSITLNQTTQGSCTFTCTSCCTSCSSAPTWPSTPAATAVIYEGTTYPLNIDEDCDCDLCISNPVISPPTPCRASALERIKSAALILYEEQRSKQKDYRRLLNNYCLNQAKTNHKVHFQGQNNEFHYTLYYYGQDGNLLKTVPPLGVRTLSSGSLASIEASRASNSTNTVPAHKLETQYFYTSSNQVYRQITPDAGESFFWYDQAGRLIASQNAKQQASNRYSYTRYDNLSRIVESGEANYSGILLRNPLNIYLNQSVVNAFYLSLTNFKSRTRTYYDEVHPLFMTPDLQARFDGGIQENLRKRIAHVTIDPDDTDLDPSTFEAGLHYSYDEIGNVKILVSQNNALQANHPNHIYKKVEYDYDLIAGKVNKVKYQENYPDQYYYRYLYDADNRISSAESSFNDVIYENDASYQYYHHGPLARSVLGENEVQGVDYAYTLQGWLKGINSSTLNPDYDMGRDGTIAEIAKDAIALTLRYFQNDYKHLTAAISTLPSFEAAMPTAISGNNLYNGNISSQTVSVFELLHPTLSYKYKYDQLNRLLELDAYKQNTIATNNNLTTAALVTDYKERVAYDPNGNITSYSRHRDGGQLMDNLTYKYDAVKENQLKQVSDAVTNTSVYDKDIEDQSNPTNYTYDLIGNLERDRSENLYIEWLSTGKIGKITNSAKNQTIEFGYDPMGHRIRKTVWDLNLGTENNTYYKRDAQGNTLAVYDNNKEDITKNPCNFSQTEYNDVQSAIDDAYTSCESLKADAIAYQNCIKSIYENYGINTPCLQVLYDKMNYDKYTLNLCATNAGTWSLTSFQSLVFEETVVTPRYAPEHLMWREQHLYGSSRLGMLRPDLDIVDITALPPADWLAMKQYELTNHLGNVLSTVKDEKLQLDLNCDGLVDAYEPIVLHATDYFPFGMPMPNRQYSLSSSSYRFGFNTQEKDDEIYGAGNLYSALFWEYDSRIGRRWNIDPKTYTWESPYAVNSNNPIWIMDILGDKGNKSNEAKQKERYEKKWEEKVITPLKTMEQALRLEGHMSDDQIRDAVQDKADELSVKYQNTKWLQYQYRGASEKKSNESYTSTATGQEHKSVIRINAYSTTTTNVSIDNNRPADGSMVTSGNTRIDAPPGSTVNVQFNPYIQPNSLQVLTGGSRNVVASTGGMIAGPNNPTGFTFNQTVVLSTANAGNIYYRVQNSNLSNTSDTWQLRISVTTPLTLNPKVTAENPQYEAYKLFGR
jgi:hypothetical protein